MAHLAMGKRAPREWIEFVLMDRFKKSGAEVRAWTLTEVLRLLTMMSAESKATKARYGRH